MCVTYDATSKKWYRHMMDNMGGGGMESSSGLPAGATEGKMVWEGEEHGMGMQFHGRDIVIVFQVVRMAQVHVPRPAQRGQTQSDTGDGQTSSSQFRLLH